MGATSQWRAPPGWAAIRQQVFAAKGRRCHWCGRYAASADHWPVPAALGGPAELWNLVPSCLSCNSSRGASFGNRLRPGAPARRGGKPAAARPPPGRANRCW